jgi:hypothetical protein
MALEDDLAAWVADRPDWQKDAVRRFCRNEALSDDDITSIAKSLVSDSYPAAASISPQDVPGASDCGEPVTLEAVGDVAGINALLPNQRLTFGNTGLTIVYGDNASGKSGFARLIRQAVTARVKADLLGDVFATPRDDQRALFECSVGGRLRTWRLGEEPRQELSSIRLYDEECGDAYVTTASEIAYRPSALTLLDRLSAACDRLQQELGKRLTDNKQQRPAMPLLPDGTRAKAFLDALNAGTTQEQIDAATVLASDHDAVLAAKLQEAARLQGSNPHREKERLEQLAGQWDSIRNRIEILAPAVNAEAISKLASDKARCTSLREAARIASQNTFDAEPLDGVGSETWRALWEAARSYSTTTAYHDHEFPFVGEGAVCVLCQQPLSTEGNGRLTRFEAFVTDTTSREADSAERDLDSIRRQLAVLGVTPPPVTTALGQLAAAGEDVAAVQGWLTTAAETANTMVSWIEGTRSDAPTAPASVAITPIDQRREQLRRASEAIDAGTFDEQLKTLQREIADLQAQAQLAGARAELAMEVERLKIRAKIEAAKRLTDTTGITRKATQLSTEHVTSVVRDQFTRETERLHLRRVTLDPARGRRHATLEHQPKLLGAQMKAEIDDVLSEGEQTALGLAGFLTEVEFDESKSAAVLDDPVSSLDAGRRSRVATRLAELAQDRQVIVFTHEATFVNDLNKAARDHGVGVTERAILRQGERPGLVSDKHPWSVKDTRSRIDWLSVELGRLRKERSQLNTDEYTQRAQFWAGRLSQAWERAINLDVVNELVDRGTNEVRPRMFRLLVGITEQDDNDYQSGYAKASGWAPRHDQAPETNFIAPEPDELELELDRFKAWVDRIKGYKK